MNSLPAPRFPIAVVLATYNGARYLGEQLDSLWQQTRQDFELLVRDDGSTDDTLQIVRAAAAERPGRVRIVGDDLGRLGPKGSFAALLAHTDARWIAFCDQDDRWLAQKLERQAATLETLEAQAGAAAPLLCCSDAAVTDEQLRVVEPSSYFARHNISVHDGRDLALPRLLFRNYAIGATTMINAALAARCRPLPQDAVMHDWWCALVACVSGRSVVLPEPLILYRQHGENAVGSRRRDMPRSSAQLQEYIRWAQASSARCVRQAQALHRAVEGAGLSADAATHDILRRYDAFTGQQPLARAVTVLGTRSFKPGFALNGLHLYACVTAPL